MLQLPHINHHQLQNIVPVIIASSDNLDDWPISRVKQPVQFQRLRNQPSPFAQCASAMADLLPNVPIYISVQSTCLAIAQDQLAELFGEEIPNQLVEWVIESGHRGSMSSTITMCLHALSQNQSARLLIIDAKTLYDWQTVEKLIMQLLEHEQDPHQIVAFGAPSNAENVSNSPIVVRTEKTEFPYLFHYSPTTSESNARKFRLGDLTIASAQVLLDQVNALQPMFTSACIKAVERARQNENAQWLDMNIWSSIEEMELGNTLVQLSNSCLMRPAEIHSQRPESMIKNTYEHNCTNCDITSNGHLVAVVGCSDLKVVSTPDATLIVKSGEDAQVAPILHSLRSTERPEIFETPVQRAPWGIETYINSHRTFEVVNIEVFPDNVLPTRNAGAQSQLWTVLHGSGEIQIDGKQILIGAGSTVIMPANSNHSCKNTSRQSLLIQQTRFVGKFTNITLPEKAAAPATLQAPELHHHHNIATPHVLPLQKTTNDQQIHRQES